MNLIHTCNVKEDIAALGENKILEEKPPDVKGEEKTLNRRTRTYLTQLRSGFSPLLKSYMYKIGQTDSDACPNCGHRPHDTRHLFACPNKPTDLTVVSLWSDPVGSAMFLGLNGTAEGSLRPGRV